MSNIFIVDDDQPTLFILNKWFTAKGFQVKTFKHSDLLMDCLRNEIPDVILLDVYLNGEHGGDVCMRIKERYQSSILVFLFSSALLTYEEFSSYNADGFILKRTSLEKLTQIVESYMYSHV